MMSEAQSDWLTLIGSDLGWLLLSERAWVVSPAPRHLLAVLGMYITKAPPSFSSYAIIGHLLVGLSKVSCKDHYTGGFGQSWVISKFASLPPSSHIGAMVSTNQTISVFHVLFWSLLVPCSEEVTFNLSIHPSFWEQQLYCREPPHMGLRDYGGGRTDKRRARWLWSSHDARTWQR